jgi:transcriptional regulator with XRE-family HTH domain
MEQLLEIDGLVERRLAERLKQLRGERGWSLKELAGRSGVSRATLSRLEKAEGSPTTAVLAKLCTAYGLTLSRLMAMAEEGFAPLVRPGEQAVWRDRKIGFTRRSLSPPSQALAGELLECEIEAGRRIAYEAPPRPGLEHHLLLLEGELEVTLEGRSHRLSPGDCLRYQLFGASAFRTFGARAARYLLFTL